MNVTGKQQPELIERPASLLVPTSTKSGIALLYNEETNNTYDVCLKLTKEVLTIQKLDVVCTSGSESQVNKLPLSKAQNCCTTKTGNWRSGLKHQRRCRAQRACGYFKDFQRSTDQTGKLFVGDAVLQVNGINVEPCTHEEVAPSPPSPSANEPKYEKRWLDAVSLPLLMARVSRYKAGTDKLRSNCFEVFTLNGASTNILQFCTAAESTDWLQAISTNINDLTQENIKIVNKYCSSDDQIIHMGWACESPEGSTAVRTSAFKYLALRGPYFHIFRSPPIGAADWGQAETTYHLYEVLFKVHKLWMAEDCWLQARLYLGLEHSPEQQDNESLSFSILVGHGQSHTFRVELATDLAIWEKSFQRAVFLEVQRIRSKSYMCSSQGNVLCFTIDFGSGFTCSEGTSKTVLWRYKFSQLKGSSDDGKTRVKLLFKNAESKQIEMKELEFANLTAVLHCIHSFIAAKVASMDPLFMCGQSFPGNYMNS
ncbi:gamma-2-syntrophin isoform X4 [Micropterus salmoides]|uniref:gamma-2-syntrophin isoform X4 n=1 Tax=Micropterus salmoides TaxID=27706 RepID=UPI0018EB3C1F|nr:gamma-2-syntrophin isoform X4 [Micropterus salmoides]